MDKGHYNSEMAKAHFHRINRNDLYDSQSLTPEMTQAVLEPSPPPEPPSKKVAIQNPPNSDISEDPEIKKIIYSVVLDTMANIADVINHTRPKGGTDVTAVAVAEIYRRGMSKSMEEDYWSKKTAEPKRNARADALVKLFKGNLQIIREAKCLGLGLQVGDGGRLGPVRPQK